MLVSSDVRWEDAKFFAVSRVPSPPPFTYGAPSPRERRCWGLGCYLITCGATLCTSSMSQPPHTALVLRHICSESLANVRSARVFSSAFGASVVHRCPLSSTAVHCRPLLSLCVQCCIPPPRCRRRLPPLSCIRVFSILPYIDFRWDTGDSALFGCEVVKMRVHVQPEYFMSESIKNEC